MERVVSKLKPNVGFVEMDKPIIEKFSKVDKHETRTDVDNRMAMPEERERILGEVDYQMSLDHLERRVLQPQ